MTREQISESRTNMLEFHDNLIDLTESLEPYALHLCYLYPAILRGSYIEIDRSIKKDLDFYKFLDDNFGSTHFIWKHIKVYD